jgi:hypothetical protein
MSAFVDIDINLGWKAVPKKANPNASIRQIDVKRLPFVP